MFENNRDSNSFFHNTEDDLEPNEQDIIPYLGYFHRCPGLSLNTRPVYKSQEYGSVQDIESPERTCCFVVHSLWVLVLEHQTTQ